MILSWTISKSVSSFAFQPCSFTNPIFLCSIITTVLSSVNQTYLSPLLNSCLVYTITLQKFLQQAGVFTCPQGLLVSKHKFPSPLCSHVMHSSETQYSKVKTPDISQHFPYCNQRSKPHPLASKPCPQHGLNLLLSCSEFSKWIPTLASSPCSEFFKGPDISHITLHWVVQRSWHWSHHSTASRAKFPTLAALLSSSRNLITRHSTDYH